MKIRAMLLLSTLLMANVHGAALDEVPKGVKAVVAARATKTLDDCYAVRTDSVYDRFYADSSQDNASSAIFMLGRFDTSETATYFGANFLTQVMKNVSEDYALNAKIFVKSVRKVLKKMNPTLTDAELEDPSTQSAFLGLIHVRANPPSYGFFAETNNAEEGAQSGYSLLPDGYQPFDAKAPFINMIIQTSGGGHGNVSGIDEADDYYREFVERNDLIGYAEGVYKIKGMPTITVDVAATLQILESMKARKMANLPSQVIAASSSSSSGEVGLVVSSSGASSISYESDSRSVDDMSYEGDDESGGSVDLVEQVIRAASSYSSSSSSSGEVGLVVSSSGASSISYESDDESGDSEDEVTIENAADDISVSSISCELL